MTSQDIKDIKAKNKANLKSLPVNGRVRLRWSAGVALIGDLHRKSHRDEVLSEKLGGVLPQEGFLRRLAGVNVKGKQVRKYSAPNNLNRRSEFEGWMSKCKVTFDGEPAKSVHLDHEGKVVEVKRRHLVVQ